MFRLRWHPPLLLTALILPLMLIMTACNDSIQEVEEIDKAAYGEFASVSTGKFHTCEVRTDSSVSCWGRGQARGLTAGWNLP